MNVGSKVKKYVLSCEIMFLFSYLSLQIFMQLNHLNTVYKGTIQFSSVAQCCLTLQPHGPQHARPPCPSPTPGVYLDSCPSSRWCHPAISSSVIPFSSCLQSFPASGSFQMSQLFTIRIHTCIKFENYNSQILLWFEE